MSVIFVFNKNFLTVLRIASKISNYQPFRPSGRVECLRPDNEFTWEKTKGTMVDESLFFTKNKNIPFKRNPAAPKNTSTAPLTPLDEKFLHSAGRNCDASVANLN